MSQGVSARVQCAQCSAKADASASKCAACGGRVIKLCGGCQAQNSPAKNFCDQCGSPLLLLAPAPNGGTASARPSLLPRTAVLGIINASRRSPSASQEDRRRGGFLGLGLWLACAALAAAALAIYGPRACQAPSAVESP